MARSGVWERALPHSALRLYFHSAGNKEIWLDLKGEGSIGGADLIKRQVNVNTQHKSFAFWPLCWFGGVKNWSSFFFLLSSAIEASPFPPPTVFLHHSHGLGRLQTEGYPPCATPSCSLPQYRTVSHYGANIFLSQHIFRHYSFYHVTPWQDWSHYFIMLFCQSVVWYLALLAFLSHPGWRAADGRADGWEETTEHRLWVPVSPGGGQAVRLEESRESQDLES